MQANLKAEVELAALAPKTITKLPAWHIVAPPPAQELLADYKAAEAAIGVPWQYLAAIHFIESRMGRIRGNSTAGAQGPMQFLPATWTQYGNGGDIQNPKDAIFAAARLLKHNGAPGNMDNALFNYNRSPHYVAAVTAYAQVMAGDERLRRLPRLAGLLPTRVRRRHPAGGLAGLTATSEELAMLARGTGGRLPEHRTSTAKRERSALPVEMDATALTLACDVPVVVWTLEASVFALATVVCLVQPILPMGRRVELSAPLLVLLLSPLLALLA